MRELLKLGVAVHHSGILPILKEVTAEVFATMVIIIVVLMQVVELLFQKGLVKVRIS